MSWNVLGIDRTSPLCNLVYWGIYCMCSSDIYSLRKSKEQELEGLLSTTSNPQSLQFLMEQMKQSAAGLTALQFNIGKSHQVNLDERELTMNSRDQQLKVLQECLQKQQEENDKERSRLQELLAKMEVQIREQERQLHQVINIRVLTDLHTCNLDI